METKEIIRIAKENFTQIFNERIVGEKVLLEELVFKNDIWEVTLSFLEESDRSDILSILQVQMRPEYKRVYKKVLIDSNGGFQGIKNY